MGRRESALVRSVILVFGPLSLDNRGDRGVRFLSQEGFGELAPFGGIHMNQMGVFQLEKVRNRRV